MPVIVVMNPKGGVGSNTPATQITGCFAVQGRAALPGDVDRQPSARARLGLRPRQAAPITVWHAAPAEDARKPSKPPKGASRVVLDAPAGLHARRFGEMMRLAGRIVVPLQPGSLDIAGLKAHQHGGRVAVGIVGMRSHEDSLSGGQSKDFPGTPDPGPLDVPVPGYLRDTQNHGHPAAHGRTPWHVAQNRVERDLRQWQPIVEWLDA